MKKTTLFVLFFAFLLHSAANAQGNIQLGTILVEDQGHRLIHTSDGGYITAGSAGTKAVLYKTDCLGNLVAQIEKTFVPGPAVFWDVIELGDGSILAVGGAVVDAPSGAGTGVYVLKTNANLVETASANFRIQGKDSQGKSIAQAASGQFLVYGEVVGDAPDLSDVFLQRIDPLTLLPSTEPAIGNLGGADLASRILATADGNYLLSGSSFSGDISNPNASIVNTIVAYKVDEFATLVWLATFQQTFLAKYGVTRVCGAVQSAQSGNFVVGGSMFNETDVLKQDLFFTLIGNDGAVLDTAYAFGVGQQRPTAIVENSAFPGAFAMLGDGEGSPLGVPSFVLGQAYETANQLFSGPATIDVNNPISLRDAVEIDPGRFAFMATLPDNPLTLGATDIIVSTPAATVGVVFQNCALAATLTNPATAFQWLLEGQAIPGANQGAYFPTAPGLYQVQIVDDKGCFGVSDTFRVNAPLAGFTVVEDGLSTTFTNTSVNATLYQWNFGDGQTSSQANPVHVYATNGNYTVTLIAKTQCGFADTISIQVGVVSSLEPSWLEHFSLSPNPTTGVFSVGMSGAPQAQLEFAMFNSVGQRTSREVLDFQQGYLQKNVDLSLLPTGVYTLQIRSGKETKQVRVVKQ
jgi:hypothetical protein